MHVQTAAVFAKNSRLDSSQFYSGWGQFGAPFRTKLPTLISLKSLDNFSIRYVCHVPHAKASLTAQVVGSCLLFTLIPSAARGNTPDVAAAPVALAGAIVPGVARFIVVLSAHADVFGVGIIAAAGSILVPPS
jgi:hypothetical protein